jgi:hypothetical protein
MPKKSHTDSKSPADINSWIAEQPPNRHGPLKSTLRSLKQAYRQQKTTDVLWWYEFGELVTKFFPKNSTFGSHVTPRLAKELAGNNEPVGRATNTIWQSRIIVKNFSKAELKKWAGKRNRKGKPLSIYHFHCVGPVEAKEQRKKLLEKCLSESWSTRRLRDEVQNEFGEKRSRGGRKPEPRPVPTPTVALQDIQLAVRQWQANHKVWFVGKKSALGHVAKRQQTEGFREELEKSVTDIQEMLVTVVEELNQLKDLGKE